MTRISKTGQGWKSCNRVQTLRRNEVMACQYPLKAILSIPDPMGTQIIRAEETTNEAFFKHYAAPGRIGLVGGVSLIDRAIATAQGKHAPDPLQTGWTHAFLLQGKRLDGDHWVIESDLEIHRRHVRLGVQENRLSKYFGDADYPRVAVLDTVLTDAQLEGVFRAALGLVADRTRYSIRELFGTLLALQRPHLRGEANRLAQERSLFCSAFVQHCFREAGIDLAPGVATKNTNPNDLAQSARAQAFWVLDRGAKRSRLTRIVRGVRRTAARLKGGRQS